VAYFQPLTKLDNCAGKELFLVRFDVLLPWGINAMKVAIYARVSTKDKGQDVRNQLEQLRAYCAKQGWHIANEYIDQRSGKNGDREQFKRMMEHSYQREFDLVLFWALDRFSREGSFATLEYLKRLEAHGVAFKSFKEEYLDSTGLFKDAIIAIIGAIANQERERLSERVVAGLERARAQGRVGGRPRKQYEKDRDAAKIRELREDGQSLQDIADELGRSKSDVARTCRMLGCAAAAPVEAMVL
jgi:DNA invertase Pin-like site-specific DNA recombinase